MSKKHKLTLYKTQNGESNYIDHKFFFNFYQELPPVQSLGVRYPNTIELPSWLVHVLCDFKATWNQEAYFSVSWIHHGTRWCLYFTFLVRVLPPPFHYSLGIYSHLSFAIHFTKSKLLARSVSVLKLPEKNALFPLLGIYLLLRNQIPAENIGVKVSRSITCS